MDDLSYFYSGNQLTKVEDAVKTDAGLKDRASAEHEMSYDKNFTPAVARL